MENMNLQISNPSSEKSRIDSVIQSYAFEYVVCIDPKRLTYVAYLICKANFGGKKRIAGVLYHLSRRALRAVMCNV